MGRSDGNLFDVSFSIGGKSRTFLTSPSALTTSLILGCGVPRECKNRVVKNVASFWRAWTAPGVRAWKSLAGSDRLAMPAPGGEPLRKDRRRGVSVLSIRAFFVLASPVPRGGGGRFSVREPVPPLPVG